MMLTKLAADAIGRLITGMKKSVHLLQCCGSGREIINKRLQLLLLMLSMHQLNRE